MRVRAVITVLLLILARQVSAQTIRVEDLHEHPPRTYALTNARVVVSPGKALERATIVIRDGLIEEVGREVEVPRDARLWDLDGYTLYPGFIDIYSAAGMRREVVPSDTAQASKNAWNPQLRSATSAAGEYIGDDDAELATMRAQGFTVVNVSPQLGLFRGQSALLSLGDGRLVDRLIRTNLAQVVNFWADQRLGGGYPASRMGAMAYIRQTLLDADWYARARAYYEQNPRGLPRPELNPHLDELARTLADERPVIFNSCCGEESLRALDLAREFQLNAWIYANGEEYRFSDEFREAGLPLILPLDYPRLPPDALVQEAESVSLAMIYRERYAPEGPARLAAAGVEFALTMDGLSDSRDFLSNLRLAVGSGLSPDIGLAALTTTPATLLGIEKTHGTLEAGRAANIVVSDGDLFVDPSSRIRAVFIDGARFEIESTAGAGPVDRVASTTSGGEPVPGFAPLPPFIEYGRSGLPEQPRHLLVQGATIWTMGPGGTIDDADLLIEDGRIIEVGQGLDIPAGAQIIDGQGRHITPGLIDPHLHSSINFQSNEMASAVVPEVRIGEMLSIDSNTMYRQLAGGLTTALIMHGSANPIGGQNQLIKLRWGGSVRDYIFEGAPRSIKFALGENAKRLSTRYPTTRMGTEQIIRDHLEAARDYARRWREWEAEPEGIPPRRDLRMEALVDILDGELQVMVHVYRQGDMLMLMRIAEEFGFRIRAFHHATEAYKIAPELAEHGAAAAVWSDWSSFMYEAYDATTYNARVLLDGGVLVSLHSDDSEVSTRMNWEAAKLLRTGLSEEEALALVTINPARLLGIDRWVGSLEVGKDADFVIWSANPLTNRARVEETWIDGRRYFDEAEDLHLPWGLDDE